MRRADETQFDARTIAAAAKGLFILFTRLGDISLRRDRVIGTKYAPFATSFSASRISFCAAAHAAFPQNVPFPSTVHVE